MADTESHTYPVRGVEATLTVFSQRNLALMTAPTKLVYVRAKKDTEGHIKSITVNKRSDPR